MNFAAYDQNVMCQNLNADFSLNSMYLNGQFVLKKPCFNIALTNVLVCFC